MLLLALENLSNRIFIYKMAFLSLFNRRKMSLIDFVHIFNHKSYSNILKTFDFLFHFYLTCLINKWKMSLNDFLRIFILCSICSPPILPFVVSQVGFAHRNKKDWQKVQKNQISIIPYENISPHSLSSLPIHSTNARRKKFHNQNKNRSNTILFRRRTGRPLGGRGVVGDSDGWCARRQPWKWMTEIWGLAHGGGLDGSIGRRQWRSTDWPGAARLSTRRWLGRSSFWLG